MLRRFVRIAALILAALVAPATWAHASTLQWDHPDPSTVSGYVVSAGDFNNERLQDARLIDLIGRIRLNVVEGMAKTAASVAVQLADGTRLEERTSLALGNPGNPMSWTDMESKFLGLVQPLLGRSSKAIFSCLRRLETRRDIELVFVAINPSAAS